MVFQSLMSPFLHWRLYLFKMRFTIYFYIPESHLFLAPTCDAYFVLTVSLSETEDQRQRVPDTSSMVKDMMRNKRSLPGEKVTGRCIYIK